MNIEQVAVQPYTVRAFFNDEAQIRSSLERIARIGYKAVEASFTNAVPYPRFKEICDSLGLAVSSVIDSTGDILERPERVAERVAVLGTPIVCYVFPREVDLGSADSVTRWIAALDRAGAVLREAGLQLVYHNHSHELRKLGGRTILERIFDETDPRNLGAELDTYWLQAGGGDPVAWIRRVAGRILALHIKDLGVGPDNKPTFYEIGQGNLDFPAIVKAAEAGGCKWFVVEQDSSAGDPFDALAMSFDYIKSRLTQGVEMRG